MDDTPLDPHEFGLALDVLIARARERGVSGERIAEFLADALQALREELSDEVWPHP